MNDSAGKLVVFTSSLSYSVRKGIVAIDRARPNLRWLILLHSPQKTPRRLLRSQWRNLKRNGWRWIPYQLDDIWHRLTAPSIPEPANGQPGAEYTMASLRDRPNVEILQVENIHAEPVLARLREFAPDLGLSLAAPILRPPLYQIPRLGSVNLHKGKVPDYRGMPPAFWELMNDETRVGCTIHAIEEKLDTGEIAAKAEIERERFSTLKGLQLRLDEVGVELMRDVVEGLLDGKLETTPQPGGGKTYRKPTLSQVAELGRKMKAVEPVSSNGAGAFVKQSAVKAAWRGARTVSRLAAPRITVVLYHRVSDDARDNLTVGIEQFDRQMALLRRYFEPMSLEEVLASSRIEPSPKPRVAVSFDDGYLDNAVNAAPILERHAIPAAFFVSTGLIGTERRFPHDERRGNEPIPLMTWDHLREMRSRGFTIGSHSVSHIDCAREPGDVVRRELEESRDALRRELGLTEVVFAYPYGGREHMTPERLRLVQQAGYTGCLSAYGGTNVGSVDPFDVRRRGIHWEFTDDAFLLACTGLR